MKPFVNGNSVALIGGRQLAFAVMMEASYRRWLASIQETAPQLSEEAMRGAFAMLFLGIWPAPETMRCDGP